MAGTVVFEEQVEIPLNLGSLAEFRRWALSDDFPERGRIDFLAGRIEVDVSPEDFFCHGTLKVELIRVLSQRVKDARSQQLVFLIHQRGKAGYQAMEADSEGFQRSAVLGCGFRLDGQRDARGNWTFDLRERQLNA